VAAAAAELFRPDDPDHLVARPFSGPRYALFEARGFVLWLLIAGHPLTNSVDDGPFRGSP
jgi:hypothetical protein